MLDIKEHEKITLLVLESNQIVISTTKSASLRALKHFIECVCEINQFIFCNRWDMNSRPMSRPTLFDKNKSIVRDHPVYKLISFYSQHISDNFPECDYCNGKWTDYEYREDD